jgi:hypothetical protein
MSDSISNSNPDHCSNVEVRSNVILDSMSLKRSMPGDFAALAYPVLMKDVRTRNLHFTQSQVNEYRQTIICCYCNSPCAGTCGWWRSIGA